jgi:hypothetical protein
MDLSSMKSNEKHKNTQIITQNEFKNQKGSKYTQAKDRKEVFGVIERKAPVIGQGTTLISLQLDSLYDDYFWTRFMNE